MTATGSGLARPSRVRGTSRSWPKPAMAPRPSGSSWVSVQCQGVVYGLTGGGRDPPGRHCHRVNLKKQLRTNDLRRITVTVPTTSYGGAWLGNFTVVIEPAGLSNCGDSQISDHPHGSSTRSRVPPPAGLSRRRAPPMAATRSLMPARPVPRHMSAPPCPSSATSTTRRPSST